MRTSALYASVILAACVANVVCASEIFSDDFDDCNLTTRWSAAVGHVEPVEVNGRVWHDRLANGELDLGVEAGQSSWTVWADADDDGVFDTTSETSTTSESGGWFSLVCVPAGSYDIHLVERPGWVVTTPSSGEYPMNLASGEVRGGTDFGTERQAGMWDFGDAPDPTYPTWDQRWGAAHLLGSGVHLGAAVDAEDNGMPSPDATGDGADDDGITFVDPLTRGTSARVEVVASAPGYFDLWIDVGRDGFWVQPEDHVIDSEPVVAGTNTLQAKIPADSLWGPTFARARISSTTGLSYGGETADGEVEDYAEEIELEYPQDFGDAPDTFGTLGGSGGAIHELQVDTFLGRNADGETNGQPTSVADGDDDSFFDDEDGIEEFSHLVPDDPAMVTVRSSAEAYLDAWVDFNQDGVWVPSERILLGQPLLRGLQDFTFDVPDSADFGDTHARFRMSSQAGASVGGLLALGEVEDVGKIMVEALDWGDAPDLDEGPFETKINALSPEQGDSFGCAVDLSGDRAIVGAQHRSYNKGSVYFYRWDGAGWVEEAVFDGSATGKFGFDVAIDGTRAVVGQQLGGKAHVYEHDGAAWAFKSPLLTTAGHSGDSYGSAVDLIGSLAIVGARHTEIAGRTTGAAYVFEDDSGTWKQVATLTAEDGGHGDSFGLAVAIEAGRAVVGALDADGEAAREGAAYVFSESGGVWSFQQRLSPADAAENRRFGACVAIDGDRILVADRGNAYVFEWNSGSSVWEERQKLTGGGADPETCGLDGLWAVLGQPSSNDDGYDAGAARLYHFDGAQWKLWSDLHARDAGPGHIFGQAAAVDGMRAIVGARYADAGALERTGAAYVYDWLLDTNHYPTLAVNDGAYHSVLGNLRFGGGVDIESDGRPTDGADGDDLDHHPDEDGVTFTTVLVPGDTATVQVVVTNNAYLDAWIDFDSDGDWDSPGEQIFVSTSVTPGLNTLNFDVPSWAVLTPQGEPTVSRFRVSFTGGLGPGGYAGDAASGEVEDHPVEILGN